MLRIKKYIAEMDVARFNRWCMIVTLLWLLTGPAVSIVLRPNYGDFPQFYMGGTMARLGEWDALYPIPRPGSHENPGESRDSAMRPRYAEVAQQCGVGNSFRFISMPPMAVLLIPLSLVPIALAQMAWVEATALLGWWVTVQAGRSYERIIGRPSRVAGVLMLVTGLSLTMVRTLRSGNVSPVVALCVGAMLTSLLDRRDVKGAFAMVVGFLAKYATGPLLLLPLVLGRWRTVTWGLGLVGVGLGLSLAVMGTGPFRVFATEIAPTLNRSALQAGNQSVCGMLMRQTGQQPLSNTAATLLASTQWGLLAVVASLIIWRRATFRQPAMLMAGAAALLGWTLLFGPVVWPHYVIYLYPVYGWLAWEAHSSRRTTAVVVAAIGLAWTPFPGITWLPLAEPWASYMLWSNTLVFILAVRRLAIAAPHRAEQSTASAGDENSVTAGGDDGRYSGRARI